VEKKKQTWFDEGIGQHVIVATKLLFYYGSCLTGYNNKIKANKLTVMSNRV
jgi:hypothetical protein